MHCPLPHLHFVSLAVGGACGASTAANSRKEFTEMAELTKGTQGPHWYELGGPRLPPSSFLATPQ